jgi:hypothetical protein
MMQVTIAETEWRVTREPGVAVGAVGPDNKYPIPEPSGLRFTSTDGQCRFLRMPISELPSKEALSSMPLSQLHEWFISAESISEKRTQ